MSQESTRKTVIMDEVRAYLTDHKLSHNDAAGICLVSPRTFRRWMAGKPPMPIGMWELLQLKVNRIEHG